MKDAFYPFTDLRTGVEIKNFYDETYECFRLSHFAPHEKLVIQTQYGKWVWGRCAYCDGSIESWSHPNYCGHCGQKIIWEDMQSNV